MTSRRARGEENRSAEPRRRAPGLGGMGRSHLHRACTWGPPSNDPAARTVSTGRPLGTRKGCRQQDRDRTLAVVPRNEETGARLPAPGRLPGWVPAALHATTHQFTAAIRARGLRWVKQPGDDGPGGAQVDHGPTPGTGAVHRPSEACHRVWTASTTVPKQGWSGTPIVTQGGGGGPPPHAAHSRPAAGRPRRLRTTKKGSGKAGPGHQFG